MLEYDGTDLADLNTYYTNAHQTNNVPITLLSTDGTSTSCLTIRSGCDDTEQTLDMTQALGMAPGLVQPGDVRRLDRRRHLQRHGDGQSAATTIELFLGLDARPIPAPTIRTSRRFAAQGQNFFQASGDSGKWTARN